MQLPEAVERAMLMDAGEQFQRTRQIGPIIPDSRIEEQGPMKRDSAEEDFKQAKKLGYTPM
jgi:hypothetical protein